jgi:hypothetical protein
VTFNEFVDNLTHLLNREYRMSTVKKIGLNKLVRAYCFKSSVVKPNLGLNEDKLAIMRLLNLSSLEGCNISYSIVGYKKQTNRNIIVLEDGRMQNQAEILKEKNQTWVSLQQLKVDSDIRLGKFMDESYELQDRLRETITDLEEKNKTLEDKLNAMNLESAMRIVDEKQPMAAQFDIDADDIVLRKYVNGRSLKSVVEARKNKKLVVLQLNSIPGLNDIPPEITKAIELNRLVVYNGDYSECNKAYNILKKFLRSDKEKYVGINGYLFNVLNRRVY